MKFATWHDAETLDVQTLDVLEPLAWRHCTCGSVAFFLVQLTLVNGNRVTKAICEGCKIVVEVM